MMGVFIGLGGRLAAGKDVVADHLVEAYGFTKVGMSDPLLKILLITDPWIPVNAKEGRHENVSHGEFMRASEIVADIGYVDAKKNPEVRRLLQMIGDNAGRRIHGDQVWLDYHERFISPLLEFGVNVVLTGVRYPNEVELVEHLGGVSVWVDRPQSEPSTTSPAHESEISVGENDFDYTVSNTGTITDLQYKTDRLLKEWTNQ
jgi:hypothetical protein